MGHDDDGGQFAGQYVVQTLKAKRIAVIDDRTAFGQGWRTSLLSRWTHRGSKSSTASTSMIKPSTSAPC